VVAEVLAVKIYVCRGVSAADLKVVKALAKLFLVYVSLINTAAAEVCATVVAVLVVPCVGKSNGGAALIYRRICAVLDKLPALVNFNNLSHKISLNGYYSIYYIKF
jgi:hypothetical protein